MSSFKCVIPGVSLKVFGRAIQSLSKIGHDLYIEPLEEGLFLRSVNSSRSAYACFQFAPNFFIDYIDGVDDAGDSDSSQSEGFRCKLGMKSVMAVFRSLSNIEKTVEKCKISLNMKEAKLIFQLCCRHGIVKTHNLSFMESETLQAVFSKDLCPNKLTAEPKLLCDAVLNFQANQEEVTLIVRPDFIALKNYLEDESNPSRVVHTELTLVPDEFDHFQVGVDTDITFCLKEFRAVLAFADVTNLPLSAHFEEAGRPVTFAITSNLSFEANFVLATLAVDEMEDNADRNRKQSRHQTSAKTQNMADKKGKDKNRTVPSSSAQRNVDEEDEDMELAMMDIQDITVVDPRNKDINANSDSVRINNNNNNDSNRRNPNFCLSSQHSQQDNNNTVNECQHEKNSRIPTSKQSTSDTSNKRRSSPMLSISQRTGDNDCDRLQPKTFLDNFKKGNSSSATSEEKLSNVKPPGKLLSLKSNPSSHSQSGDESVSPVVPLVCTPNGITSLQEEEEAEEFDDDEEIAGTPPSKKFRSLFFGTQSSTQSTQQSQKNVTVLAPDSDCDD